MDINNLHVPVTETVEERDEEGRASYKQVTKLEPINLGGKQSDGSEWTIPTKLIDDDHEHNFELKNPTDRQVFCDCGFGGDVFPHNSVIKNGHIYDLKGNKVA